MYMDEKLLYLGLAFIKAVDETHALHSIYEQSVATKKPWGMIKNHGLRLKSMHEG